MKIVKNEICYILVGKRIGRYWFGQLVKKIIGSAVSVEFDWEWVLKREEMKGDVLGFWHSHQTDIRPSVRDIKTMLAWIRCFGKMLVCVIQTENYRASYLCVSYEPNIHEKEPGAWKFFEKLFKFGNFFFGVAE